MKIGLVADLHAGYSRGTREVDGVNVREQDILDAVTLAVGNLVSANVDAIVDLGDLFHVPHPRKRALLHIIHTINESGLPWFSVNGNHTLQRTKSDLHIYDVLEDLCPKFHGYTTPTVVGELSAYLIPYGEEVEALQRIPEDIRFVAGHFACDDVPFPGEHVSAKDLPDIPTFLGHYHTRQLNMTVDYYVPEEAKHYAAFKGGLPSATYQGPVYIGATERFAWGEAKNPTGVAVLDADTKIIEFIEHETRAWVDLSFKAEEITDGILGVGDLEGKIVRVNVEGTPAEYHGLDIKAVRDIAKGALEFQIRRAGSVEAFTPDTTDTQTYSLLDAWGKHTQGLKPAEMRKQVRTIGERALSTAGVGE